MIRDNYASEEAINKSLTNDSLKRNLFRDNFPNAQRSADLFRKATTSMGFSVVIDEE